MKNACFYTTILITAALAVFVGYYSATQCADVSSIAQTIILYVVALAICWYFSLQMHECGHKLFGIFAGFDVKIKANRFFSSAIGCEISPRHAGNIKPRYIATAAGGLIVNLALLIAGVVFVCLPCTIFGENLITVALVMRSLLPVSFYIFAVNVLPFEYKSGKTDGLAMIEALRGDDSYKVAEAILNVQGYVNSGVQLKDIDEQLLFNVPQLPEDDDNFLILTELRYEYFKARGDAEKAQKFKERYEELQE